MSKRRKYSEEFKREAVEMTLGEGAMAQVAREFGIEANTLDCWRRELKGYGVKAFPGQGREAAR